MHLLERTRLIVIGAPEMGSMPTPGPQQALIFDNINMLAIFQVRANPIYGHPYGLPRKDPSSGSHGPRNTLLGGYCSRGRNGFGGKLPPTPHSLRAAARDMGLGSWIGGGVKSSFIRPLPTRY